MGSTRRTTLNFKPRSANKCGSKLAERPTWKSPYYVTATLSTVLAILAVLLFCVLSTTSAAAAEDSSHAAQQQHRRLAKRSSNFFINGRYGKRADSPLGVAHLQQHRISSKSSLWSSLRPPFVRDSRSLPWFNKFGQRMSPDYDPRPFYINTRYGKRSSAHSRAEDGDGSGLASYDHSDYESEFHPREPNIQNKINNNLSWRFFFFRFLRKSAWHAPN